MKITLIVSTAASLFGGMLIMAGNQSASTAPQTNELPQQAFDLLDKRCGQCHGETGSNKDLMLISRTGRDDLVGKRSEGEKKLLVDTAKPEASLLYLRITGKHPNGVMPPSYAAIPTPLTSVEQALLLKWIQAGAPDWKNVRQVRPQRRFISNADILKSIGADLKNLDVDRQKDTRYFTLTHLYNAGVSDTEIAAYRDGLKRLLNSLSWEGEIIKPETIDPERTIFRINLKKYGWKTSTWETILKLYPYNVHLDDAPFASVCNLTDCKLPFIRADWFVTHAALPPLYHDILELPSGKGSDVALEKMLLDQRRTRDGQQDIVEAPGERVWSSGFRKSGVSSNNRGLEWHQCLNGYYVKSNDFSDVTGFQNLKVHPLDFQRAGGEIIFGLPNGLQGYMLVGKDGTRLDVAPSNIVSNDKSTTKDKNIYNGLSCMGCHTQGMIEGFDIEEVRNAIARFTDDESRRKGLKLYSERAQIQKLLDDGKKRYRDALAKLDTVAGTNEPIVTLAEKFQGDVDADLASAELGLLTSMFQEIVKSLNDPVLNDLRDGKIARKSWEEQISLVVGKIPGARYVSLVVIIPDPKPDPHKEPIPKTNPSAGLEMIPIPAGEFLMGDDDDGIYDAMSHARNNPRHTVYLDAYFISKNLVRVKQYMAFCAATGRNKPPAPAWGWNDDHPVVNVTWEDAEAYCKWVGGHLPTEAQWEKAARGMDGRRYPWGNVFDSSLLWHSDKQRGDVGHPAPVGSFPAGASPYGLLDMAGNAWEWCSDWYDANYPSQSPAKNPSGPTFGQYRVMRGGSWYNPPRGDGHLFRSAWRDSSGYGRPMYQPYYGDGFRVVELPDGGTPPTEKSPTTWLAKFETTRGVFIVEVHRDWSPNGADRFYDLVKSSFFDSAKFFRVVPGFVVQFGLAADPKIGALWNNATISDDPVTQSNQRGYVSFATHGPRTRTTQIFINLRNNSKFDSMGFSSFGRVIQGMDVVDNIYSGYREQPSQFEIIARGNTYLDMEFPKLDRVMRATLVSH